MTQAPTHGSGSAAPKPAPNIYTALLLVAIVAMAASLIVVLIGLMSAGGYNLQFGDLFGELQKLAK